MTLDDLALQLEALGHPTRLAIFRQLVRVGVDGAPVGQLQERIGIAASTLSHHLSRLVAVGLVEQQRQGTTLICRANFAAMHTLVDGLAAECCIEQRSAEAAPCTPPTPKTRRPAATGAR